jgi:phosphate-selective porin OprO/OprP
MHSRVAIAVLLIVVAGGGLLIAFRDRGDPPPVPPTPPAVVLPAVVLPAVQPTLEPQRVPAEAAPREDLGPPLEPLAPHHVVPPKPREIDIQDGAGMKLHTGTDDAQVPPEQVPLPKPPVEPVPEEAPPEEAPPAPEPEKPEEKGTKLVPGRKAAPLPGPVEDPADLPAPGEVEPAPTPVPGEPAPDQGTILSALNNFLRLVTLDGRVQLKVTGRLYVDGAVVNADQEIQDQIGQWNNDWEFRTARIGLIGVVDWVEFKIDYDFAGGQTLVGEPELKELWIGGRELPILGRVRIGRMKEPIGLEQWMSGNARTFMEPGLPAALTIGRNPGILAFKSELAGRLSWWAGMFGYTPNNSGFGRVGTNFSARVCGTPLYEDQGKRLLHLGLSGSYRFTPADSMSIASRPESHLAPNIVATPKFDAERQNFVGLEAAWLDGPLSLQGELQRYHVNTRENGRATFWGAYVYGSYILTGEHRIYRKGAFTRPVVTKPAFDDGIGGVFEIAVRLSHLSLSSGDFDGGTVTDETVGLTWYTDRHSRFMINYIHTHRWGSGSANILQCRLQIDF